MSIVEPARERIVRQLRGAVDRLRDDMDRVEFWTDVLGCLAQPIPDYDPGGSRLNQFRLPRWGGAAPRNGVSHRATQKRRTRFHRSTSRRTRSVRGADSRSIFLPRGL